MTILTTIIAFFVFIGLVIGVHEYGHYLAAKLSKVKIKAVGLGFGKPLYSWRNKHGTLFKFNPIFLGGYVSVLDSRNDQVSEEDEPFDYNKKPALTKFFILIAGIVMNFVFAFFCFSLVFLIGVRVLTPDIEAVYPGSPFYDKGLKPGDRVVRVADIDVLGWSAFAMSMAAHFGDKEPVSVVLKNETGALKKIQLDLSQVRLQVKDLDVFKLLNISPNKTHIYEIRYPFFKAFAIGLRTTYNLTSLNLRVLYKVLTGYISPLALAGPLTMLEQAQYFFWQGLVWFFQFLAVLSIAVGLANLLPIPGLDGGQILILMFESLRGKALSSEWAHLLQNLGYILLFMICMQLLANDFHRMSLTS